jgi:hypothetical protein
MKPWKPAAVAALLTLIMPAAARAKIVWAEAYADRPFGVGRFVLLLDGEGVDPELRSWTLEEADGRTFYPAVTNGTAMRFFAEVVDKVGADVETPAATATVFFLFQGDKPLRLRLYTPKRHDVVITPVRSRPLMKGMALNAWWREYNAQARRQEREGDYPPLIETYLTSMLGQRLRLEPPLLSRIKNKEERPQEPIGTLELLLGTEKVRLAAMRDAMLRPPAKRQAATQPLPPDIDWSALDPPAAPPVAEDVAVEPLAMRTPEECFYIRFGQFNNLLWLDNLTEQYGGDLMRMMTLRGFAAGQSDRMRRQLVLPDSLLAEMLGQAVIADVALVGRDLFLGDGGAVGVLLQTRVDVLPKVLGEVRREAAESARGGKLETVKIAGRDVSFVSTPDNHIRSFYAVDGDFHLITTSRAMVERFFETADGSGSLGKSAEFRHARTLMPTERNDAVFVYLSSAFLRGLVSPEYQIEMYRRMEALGDLELTEMARMTARAEGRPADTLKQLIAGGFLPAGFGRRQDGSGPILETERVIDSLRGARGSLLPVPDVEIRGVTEYEAAWYNARAAFYRQNWRQMDPVMIGVRRTKSDKKGQQHLEVDVNLSPFAEEKYGWLTGVLGEPTKTTIPAAPGDAIHVEAVLDGGRLGPLLPDHHLFVGVRDAEPIERGAPDDLWTILRLVRTTPGYLGAWPMPGLLDRLGLTGEADDAGYSLLPFDVHRRQINDFSVLAFDKEVLAEVTPKLAPAEAQEEAQVRVSVGDLSTSKLAPYINELSWTRGRQLSQGNAYLLKTISQQLKVPPADARKTAERLLDVKLLCGLGGEYETAEGEDGRVAWRSTAWPEEPGAAWTMPEDYRAPLLTWFRGLDGRLKLDGDRLVMHLELEMEPKKSAAPAAGLEIPLLDLFGNGKPESKD